MSFLGSKVCLSYPHKTSYWHGTRLKLKKQQNNTKTKKKKIDSQPKKLLTQNNRRVSHKGLQNLTIFTSNGEVLYL